MALSYLSCLDRLIKRVSLPVFAQSTRYGRIALIRLLPNSVIQDFFIFFRKEWLPLSVPSAQLQQMSPFKLILAESSGHRNDPKDFTILLRMPCPVVIPQSQHRE